MSKALRYNEGKPDFSLMPLEAYPHYAFDRGEWLSEDSCHLFFNVIDRICKVVYGMRKGKIYSGEVISCVEDLCRLSDLFDDRYLEKVVRVYEVGEEKYSRFNWQKGHTYSSVIASTMRHIYAIDSDRNFLSLDEESGLPHYAHAISNLQMLYYQIIHDIGENDFAEEDSDI